MYTINDIIISSNNMIIFVLMCCIWSIFIIKTFQVLISYAYFIINQNKLFIDSNEQLSIDEIVSKYKNNINMGIHAVQFNTCILTLETFINVYPNKQIISVGSGNAILEWCVSRQTNKKIICVDPDPLSCSIGTIQKPFIILRKSN